MWKVWLAFVAVVWILSVCWAFTLSPGVDDSEDCESWFGGEDNDNV